MERTDTKTGRFYDANGRKLPSVTTILSALAKPALIGWAAKEERKAVVAASYSLYEELRQFPESVPTFEEWEKELVERMGAQRAHQKLMKEAAEIGTQVHAAIEGSLQAEINQTLPPSWEEITHPKVRECLSKWIEWRASVDLKPIAVEKRVASQDYGFAGSLDLLAEVEGELSVIDFKTGKAIYAEAYLQNVAYRLALQEEGVTARKGFIVRLPKEESDPTFEVGEVPPADELLLPFVCLIPVWRWMHEQDKAYQKKRKEAARVAN